MSKKRVTVEEAAAEIAQETEAVATAAEVAAEKKPAPRVYCGPTVRGVAKQYTVYTGDIPAALKDFIEKHPAAKALLVPVERFAQTRKQMETAGTAEAILYHKIKSEL